MNDQTADRANALYHYLMRYYADTGGMPTRREMVAAMPFIATVGGSLMYYLGILERWGWIYRPLRKADRAITLTRPTEAGLTPRQLAAVLAEYTELSEGGL